MPRRRLTAEEHARLVASPVERQALQNRAAAELDAIIGEEKKQKRPTLNWAKAERECEAMRKTNDWSSARAVHAVVLYAWCHEQCYKVAAAELVGKERLGAVSAADRLLKKEFGGKFEALVRFVKWAWHEESGKEKWAKGKGIVLSKRMTWRRQFSSALAVDYNAARVRFKGAAE